MSNKPIENTLGINQCDAELQQKIKDKSKDPFKLEPVEDIMAHRLTITDTAEYLKEEYTKEFGPGNYLDEEILTFDDGYGVEIALSIFIPKGKEIPKGGRPCFYYIHGGAFITCNRYTGLKSLFACIKEFNAVCVTVEYGLAPETDALHQKIQKNYGPINLEKVAVVGRSAGAAFLPIVCLASYGKAKCALMSFPMLDDRCNLDSYDGFKDAPFLPTKTAQFCWEQRLAGRERTQDGWTMIAPGRLSIEGVKVSPPTLIEVAKSDVLADESACFFLKLQKAKQKAQLKTYDAFHCFDLLAPESSLAETAKKNRVDYFRSQGFSD